MLSYRTVESFIPELPKSKQDPLVGILIKIGTWTEALTLVSEKG